MLHAAWAVTMGALLLLSAPAAAPAEPLEIDILESYLALHDKVDGTPHCARSHGFVLTPQGAIRSPTGATNRILEEHFVFHLETGDQPGSGFRPSPDDEDRYGIIFLEWHRQFLWAYESWRLANGHGPLEPWDPGTPMPPSLAYEYPGRGCTDGRNSDPQVALPSWATVEGGDEPDPIFAHTSLCQFKDLNQLGKSISIEYHWQFHARIGGDMTATQGPRDPAFWAGHQFINRLMDRWWEACEGTARAGSAALGGADAARPIPAPAAAAALAAVGVGALLAHARRRLR
jgi:hypothetical protein